MFMKKYIAILLVFAVCLSFYSIGALASDEDTAGQTAGGDIPSNWAVLEVEEAIGLGLVPSSLQASYTSATTRAEFAELAVIMYEKTKGEEIVFEEGVFPDTDSEIANKAFAIGVVDGISGLFAGDGSLNREQAATMLARLAKALDTPLPVVGMNFPDGAAVSDWAKEAVGQVQGAKIMAGLDNGTFSPKGQYQRQQSIATILRLNSYISDAASTLISTKLGDIRGAFDTSYDGTRVLAFKGVPFATTAARFAAPKLADTAYTGVYDATDFKQVPYQNIASGTLALLYKEYEDKGLSADEIEKVMTSESECLNLNIWTTDTTGSKPVFVWIHGGGWTVGSNRSVTSQLMSIAQEDIVCVSIGYRLGAMGWAAFESDSPNTGNLGMLDLICGLEWIQKNIADFGGDPTQVTVGGQSAGSYNVADLIRSPLSKGLFARGIMQSGSDFSVSPERVIAGTTAFAADYSGKESVSSEEAKTIMSAAPALDLATSWISSSKVTTRSTADGYVLPSDGFAATTGNNINQVDLLIGSVRDEHTLIRAGVENLAGLDGYLTRTFGADKLDAVKEHFGVTDATTDEEAVDIADHIQDISFIWNGYIYADSLSKSNNVWNYRYDYAAPAFFMPGVGPMPGFGVAHGSEINMIFKAYLDELGLDAKGYALSDNLTAAWVNFIKTGNPNGASTALSFAPYDSSNRQVTHIDIDGTSASGVPYIDDISFILETLYGYKF